MKAIIFDLDGTLWSSVDLMLEVWKSGFSKIQLPHVPLTREIVCSCMGLSTEETGKRLFPGASPEAANAATQILFEEELLVLRDKSGSIYPGVIKTMQALAEEYDLFVVSNSQDATYKASCVGRGLPACGILKCLAAPDWIKDPISGLSWSGTTLRRPLMSAIHRKMRLRQKKPGSHLFSRNTGLVMHRMPRCGSAQSKSFHRPSRPHFPKTEKQKSLQRSRYYKSGQKP